MKFCISARPRFFFTVFPCVVLALAGCASGPTDFADIGSTDSYSSNSALIKSESEKADLEKSLVETARLNGDTTKSSALPSTMALAVIRQQQVEEARTMLKEADGLQPKCAAEQRLANGTCPKLQ